MYHKTEPNRTNVCKQKTLLMQKGIVWHRIVNLYKNGFAIK